MTPYERQVARRLQETLDDETLSAAEIWWLVQVVGRFMATWRIK